jgi:hypothetical protein
VLELSSVPDIFHASIFILDELSTFKVARVVDFNRAYLHFHLLCQAIKNICRSFACGLFMLQQFDTVQQLNPVAERQIGKTHE